MANNEAKVKFTADTKEFTAEVKAANETMTGLRGELKLNQAQMKNTGETVDGLTRSQKLLEQQQLALQQKATALASKLEVSNKVFGEGSTESQKLANQLNGVRTAQERVKGQIEQTSDAISRQKAAQAESETAYSQLTRVINEQKTKLSSLEREYSEMVLSGKSATSEAKELENKIKQLSSELKDNESSMQKADKAARELSDGFDKAEKSADDMGASIGDIAAGNVIGDYATRAIDSLAGLCTETEEYRAHVNQLNTAFEHSGRTVETANEVYQNFLGLCGDSDQAIEAAQDMNNLADAGADIQTWYDIAAGSVAAFGDALPVENLIESSNETIRTGQVTGGLADALNWTSINLDALNAALGEDHPEAMAAFTAAIEGGESTEDALNASFESCSDASERQQILTEILSQQYTDLGKSFEESNADIIESRKAQDDLAQAQTELADQVRPLQTAVTSLAADGIAFLSDNLSWIAPIAAAAAVAFGALAVALGFSSIVQALTSAMALLNAVLALNPIVLAIAAIALLVGAFVALWNNCEEFRNFWITLWDGVCSIVQTAIGGVVGFFTGLWTTAQTVWDGICNVVQVAIMLLGQIFNLAIETLLIPWNFIWENFGTYLTAAWDVICNAVSGFMDTVNSVITTVLTAIFQWWESTWGAISGVASAVWEAICGAVSAYIQNVSSIISAVLSAIQSVWSSVWDAVSSVASSVWNGISSTISGIVNAISSTISSVFNAVKSTVTTVWEGIKSAIETPIRTACETVGSIIDRIKGFFNFSWSLPSLKLPHLSISGSFSIDPPSVPSFGIEWYAKGGILNKPAVFGVNNGKLQVGGEAGTEVVSPLDTLRGYMREAVGGMLESESSGIIQAINSLRERKTVLNLDGRAIAEGTASDRDSVDGTRQTYVDRGLATT